MYDFSDGHVIDVHFYDVWWGWTPLLPIVDLVVLFLDNSIWVAVSQGFH